MPETEGMTDQILLYLSTETLNFLSYISGIKGRTKLSRDNPRHGLWGVTQRVECCQAAERYRKESYSNVKALKGGIDAGKRRAIQWLMPIRK